MTKKLETKVKEALTSIGEIVAPWLAQGLRKAFEKKTSVVAMGVAAVFGTGIVKANVNVEFKDGSMIVHLHVNPPPATSLTIPGKAATGEDKKVAASTVATPQG